MRLRSTTVVIAAALSACGAMAEVSYQPLVTDDDPFPIPGYQLAAGQMACFAGDSILVGALPVGVWEGGSALLRVDLQTRGISMVIAPGTPLPQPAGAFVSVLDRPTAYGNYIAFRNRLTTDPVSQARLYLLDTVSGEIAYVGLTASRVFGFGDGRLFWCSSNALFAYDPASGVNEIIANGTTVVPGTTQTLGNTTGTVGADDHGVAFVANFGSGNRGVFYREHASGELFLIADRSTPIPAASGALFQNFRSVATHGGTVTFWGTGEELDGTDVDGIYQWMPGPLEKIVAIFELDPRGYTFHEFQGTLLLNQDWHLYTSKMKMPGGATTQSAYYAESRHDESMFLVCQHQDWGVAELGREADAAHVLDLRDNQVLFYTYFEDSQGELQSVYLATLPSRSIPADLDGSGVVDGADLAMLLGSWGTGGAGDINGDGTVDGSDLAILLGSWG